MANPKYSDVIRNPYTGEEVEITGSKEDVFLRRRDEQFDKWEKEQYIREQQAQADEMTSQLQSVNGYLNSLCYNNLHPLSPDSYFRENVARIKRRHRYKPTREDAEKDVGINLLVKAAGIIPGKPKAKLDDLKKQADTLLAKQLEEYEQHVREDEEDYQQRRKKEETIYNNRIRALSKGSIVAARQYYAYALDRDDYSVNATDRFFPEHSNVGFLPNTGEIRFSYRIPNIDEIPAIAKYEYNAKTDSIEPRSYDAKTTARRKLRIAESILLRTAAMVFLSDRFERVKTVSVTGYFRYYDSAFGNDQIKNLSQN